MVQNWDSCLEKVNNASLGEKKKVTAFFSFNFQEIVELEDLRSSHFTSSALRVPLHQWYRWKQLLGKMLLLLNHQPKPRPHIFCLYWLHYLVGFFFFFLRGAGDIFTYTAKDTDLSHGNIVGINYNNRYVKCSLGWDSNFNCDLDNKHTVLHFLCFSSAEGKSSSIGREILMSIRKLGSLCWCH